MMYQSFPHGPPGHSSCSYFGRLRRVRIGRLSIHSNVFCVYYTIVTSYNVYWIELIYEGIIGAGRHTVHGVGNGRREMESGKQTTDLREVCDENLVVGNGTISDEPIVQAIVPCQVEFRRELSSSVKGLAVLILVDSLHASFTASGDDCKAVGATGLQQPGEGGSRGEQCAHSAQAANEVCAETEKKQRKIRWHASDSTR